MNNHCGTDIQVLDYSEHAQGSGADATAVAYLKVAKDQSFIFGVGIHPNTTVSALKAVISVANRISGL